MTELDVASNPEKALRDILRLMVLNPPLETFVPEVLAAACQSVGADAAFYIVFSTPHLQIPFQMDEGLLPDTESMRATARKLTDEPYLSSELPAGLATVYQGWLLLPIRVKDRTISLLCLLFKDAFMFDDAAAETLMSLTDALQVMTAKARAISRYEKLMNNQNEFVRIVSHDLRSPLTSMQGFAYMLQSNMAGELTEKQDEFVNKILSGVSQMTSLVDNIQDAGRYDTETGFYEMVRAPTDLLTLLDKIVQNHLLPAEKQELTILSDSSDDIPIVNVDASMLERGIGNLVDNAIKYTPNGGEIRIGAHKRDGEIVISVRDNGFGISDDNLKKLFQRHFRIRRKEHKRIKGSGLGLFIVHSVAQHHDGRAGVESVEGEGSTFYITIPLKGENLLSSAQSD